jgi:hypothetical protein
MTTRRTNSRVTEGLNAQVFIAKALAYATDATFQDFANDAVDGEIGVFTLTASGNDGDATIETGALVAGDVFFIAQKQASPRNPSGPLVVKKTPRIAYSDVLAHKAEQTFVFPVKQVSHVGWNGTTGDFETTAIARHDEFGVSVLLTTEGSQPYPTWNATYTASTGDTNVEIAEGLINIFNDPQSLQNRENDTAVSAEAILVGTDTPITGTLTAVVGSKLVVPSSVSHGVAVGDVLQINSVGSYKVAAQTTTLITLATHYAGVAGAGLAGDVVTSVTATGLAITALEEGDHFDIAVKTNLEESPISYTTPFAQGTGYKEHIENLEYEGQIFDGTTTVNAAFADKYGSQTSYRDATHVYTVFTLPIRGTESSLAIPNTETTHYSTVIVAAAEAGTVGANTEGYVSASASPEATLSTVLAL